MANKKVKVEVDVTTNVEPSIAGLKELKKQLKNAAAGSEDFKRIANEIDDLEDSIKGARKGSADWIDTLEGAGGPLGMVGGGLNKLKVSFSSFNTALKASVIGLIVSALGGMVAAFSQNEAAMKKLQPIFIAFEKILGGIFRALEPVLDIFVEMAMKVLPYVTMGIGGFYSALFALFTFIKTTGLAVGKILKGIFTLDFDAVEEGIGGLKNVLSDTAKSFTDTYGRFQAGSNELTKTEKENNEKRLKDAQEAQAKRDKLAADALAKRKADLDARIQLETDKENTSKEKLLQLYKERYDAELQGQKLTDAQKQVLRDANTKKVEEALKTDTDLRQKNFDDNLKKLQDASKAEQDQLNANLNQAKVIYGENSAQVRKTQDDIFNAQSAALQKEKELLKTKQELTDAEKARIISIGVEEQNLTTTKEVENKKRIENDVATFLKAKENIKTAADAKFAQDMELAKYEFDQQQEILNAKIEQDRLYYQSLLANENLTLEQRKSIEEQYTKVKKQNADAQIDIEKKKAQATDQILSFVSQTLSSFTGALGQQTLAGKALATAAATIDTFKAANSALKADYGIFGPAAQIARFAAVAATIAVGFKNVRGIMAVQVPTEKLPEVRVRQLAAGGFVSGPGTETSDSIPAMLSNGESVINARSTSMFRPLLSTINRIGGGRQFAEGGITSQNQGMNELNMALANSQPIKTYVVAQDMTSMQMFDRAAKSRSTI